jgi:hypothetical protein
MDEREPTRSQTILTGGAMIYSSERRFQIWDYTVGHGQILLRSPSSPEQPRNVDLIFLGVEYLGIPSTLFGLGLDQAPSEVSTEVKRGLRCGWEESSVYTLVSEGRRYHVVAAAFRVYENDLDLFESSLEYFSAKDRGPQPGELLVHSGMTRQVG